MAAANGVAADIYEWVDDAHHRYYFTSLDAMPAAARAKARIVVRETPPQAGADVTISDGGEGVQRADQPSTDESFASGWDMGFWAGWEAGYRTGVAEEPACPVQPQTIVLQSGPPVIVEVSRYDPSGAYYRSPYEGTLTVPFDAGRSRGLTLRQLQEGITP
jgi:hypothetical protein